jgi:hypothetical protein
MELILLADLCGIRIAAKTNTVRLNDTPEPRDSKLANLEGLVAGQAGSRTLVARSGRPACFGREASAYAVADVVDLFADRVAHILSARRGKQHPSTDSNPDSSGKGHDVTHCVILMAVNIPRPIAEVRDSVAYLVDSICDPVSHVGCDAVRLVKQVDRGLKYRLQKLVHLVHSVSPLSSDGAGAPRPDEVVGPKNSLGCFAVSRPIRLALTLVTILRTAIGRTLLSLLVFRVLSTLLGLAGLLPIFLLSGLLLLRLRLLSILLLGILFFVSHVSSSTGIFVGAEN